MLARLRLPAPQCTCSHFRCRSSRPCHVAACRPFPPYALGGLTRFPSTRSLGRGSLARLAQFPPLRLRLSCILVASGRSLYTHPAATTCIRASLHRCFACSLHPTFPLAVFPSDSRSRRLCSRFTPRFFVASVVCLCSHVRHLSAPRLRWPRPGLVLGRRHASLLRSVY